MPNTDLLHSRRLEAWCQTPATRIPDFAAGAKLIERLGIITLYPASPEVPDLFHAYMGDPAAKTEPQWDSPSGEVYSWRWKLGRAEAGFYCILVHRRPTWVSWELLPAVLRLCGEERTPDELYDSGELSPAAYRVAQALERAGGVLSTGELRQEAGFPTGKEQRNAYLKAVDELDARLLLAKGFEGDEDDLRHALVAVRHREQVAAARRLSREQAWERVLAAYLPAAAYAVPTVLARHLRVEEAELRAALERLVTAGKAEQITLPARKGNCYAWRVE